MVKVQCILDYNDLQLKRLVKVGEELEVAKARAEVLVEKELVKVVEVIPEEEKTPAKKTTAKKTNKK
jgi:hypothetical protein